MGRSAFFNGQPGPEGYKDVTWLDRDAQEMQPEKWNDPHTHVVAALLCGRHTGELDKAARPVTGDSVLLLINASPENQTFTLPEHRTPNGQQTPRRPA